MAGRKLDLGRSRCPLRPHLLRCASGTRALGSARQADLLLTPISDHGRNLRPPPLYILPSVAGLASVPLYRTCEARFGAPKAGAQKALVSASRERYPPELP